MPGSTIGNQTILRDHTTHLPPHLVAFDGALYLAWTGPDGHLNVARSTDAGRTFGSPSTSGETSANGPSLCVHNGQLYIAWTSTGDRRLNVAVVPPGGGAFTGKWTGDDTSHA